MLLLQSSEMTPKRTELLSDIDIRSNINLCYDQSTLPIQSRLSFLANIFFSFLTVSRAVLITPSYFTDQNMAHHETES